MTDVPTDQPDPYAGLSDTEKLEYIGYKVLTMDNALMRIDRMVHEIGQKTTNIDAFVADVQSQLAEARKNPMMRAMLPAPRPRTPGLITPS